MSLSFTVVVLVPKEPEVVVCPSRLRHPVCLDILHDPCKGETCSEHILYECGSSLFLDDDRGDRQVLERHGWQVVKDSCFTSFVYCPQCRRQ